MSARLDIDALRRAHSLPDVVAGVTKLQRAGNEWKACCPLHQDRSPSFTIFDNGHRFQCFGCGAQGDVLDFVQQLHGVGLREAAEMLAGGNLPTIEVPSLPPTDDVGDRVDEARAIWRAAVVNTVSNSLTALAQVPEFAAGSAIGKIRTAVARKGAEDRILASEVGARALGLIQGAKEGAQLFARALRSGEADDFVSKVEGDEFKAISGLKGEVIRVPTRLLTAEDQLFKGIARRMELNAQAVRIANKEGLNGDAAKTRIAELSANPTDEMIEKSLDYGKYLTFQRQTGVIGQSLSRMTSASLPLKVIVPFVRTPINLLKFATERSPAAPLLKEWRKDFGAGGARRDMAMARAMLGTGLAMAMYEAALNGQITGAVPPDPAKAKLLYADGWQPYSAKIGDRWISYSRLDPISTTVGVAADMATLCASEATSQPRTAATSTGRHSTCSLPLASHLAGCAARLRNSIQMQSCAFMTGTYTPSFLDTAARLQSAVPRERV